MRYHLIAHRISGSVIDVQPVRDFLFDMKICLANSECLIFVDRDKNLQGLADLGLLRSELPDLLRGLTVDDFSQGPLLDDRGRQRYWWVFGPERDTIVIYLKIAVAQNRVECLSLHPAEHPMEYPFRRKETER